MLYRIAAFELRYQLRSPLFLMGFALFLLLTFGSVASPYIHLGDGNHHVNSPYAIAEVQALMSILAMWIVTAFVAGVVLRDVETGFAPILFAVPLRKSAYVVGRFAGAMAVALLLLTAVPLGLMLGSFMPWLDRQTLGPFVLTHYLYALFVIGLPALLVCGAGFFALATVTRSMMWTYVGVLASFVLYLGATTLEPDPSHDQLTALLDPFGMGALALATKYWTVTERNSLLPPLSGVLLANRLLWLAVAAVMFAVAYRLFRFETRATRSHSVPSADDGAAAPSALPRPHPARGGAGWAAFAALTRFEMRTVFRSPAFYVLLALGAWAAFVELQTAVVIDDIHFLPVTRAVIEALQNGFRLIPWIIALYYSGELVWRDRERRMHEVVDACPAPSWTLLLPKVLGVGGVLCACLLASALAGMLVQLAYGYWQLEPLHYLLWFLVPETLLAWQLAVFAVCVQSLVPHKAVGWAVMLVAIVLNMMVLPALGYEHGLYRYAYTPPVLLSDMNGMGRFWIARAWFELYWSAFATLLVMLALLLWPRGTGTRLAPRLTLAWHDLRGVPAAVLALVAAVWIGTGAFIYYNTNILNEYPLSTDLGQERYLAGYEKALLAYESVAQPKIVAVKLDVQLYPGQARADTSGSYVLENRTDAAVALLHVRWLGPLELSSLDVGPATLEKDYGRLNYRIYRLATPMAPGERRTLRFATRLEERGFRNGKALDRIAANGTFLDNILITPFIGMGREGVLTDPVKRRRNALPDVLRPPKLEDTLADAYNYLRHDSDFVDAEIAVTTDAGQTPVAPGYIVSDAVKNGRRTVVRRTEAPIMHFFSIQSARYATARDVWTGKDGRKVDLVVYYHPPHTHDIARMLKAMKASLDVFDERFSPYQFHLAHMLEFPAYIGDFGQSFANTIPVSEAGWFIQSYEDREDDGRIDGLTFGTAHELGHQWWAHQVIGADKQGDTMLSETFAQYSALLVMEKLYGREHIRKFLKYELDGYLRSRGTELVEELPLERVENQGYIHYYKGSVVMYWLKEAVGEDAVDRALKKLLATYAFKPAPYPSTTDFLAFLRQEAPGHDQLIDDLFARITLYDMKARDATAHKRADGRYEVRFTVEGKKLYADGQGKETEVPLNEPFDVGAFTIEPGKKGYSRDSVLQLERISIKGPVQSVTLVLDKLPRLVGVDPFNERIDRNSNDNLTTVKLQ